MMKKRFYLFTLLIILSFILIVACDNGSVSDSATAKSNELVRVCLAVEGDSSGIQKTSSINGLSFTYQFKAIPQWNSENIHGKIDEWTTINYSAGMSIGYFTPGQWIFYIRMISDGILAYEGNSDLVSIGASSVNITVSVNRVIQKATWGAISINISAPTVNNTDTLTVEWSGTEAETGAEVEGTDTATTIPSGSITTFTYTNRDLPVGDYTLTLTHNNIEIEEEDITVNVRDREMTLITGQIDGSGWDLEKTTLQFHNINVLRTNWGSPQNPEYCGTMDMDVDSAVSGERVYISPRPVPNSSVDSLTVTCNGQPVTSLTGDGDVYSFIMPDADVTVNVTFSYVNGLGEVDVLIFKSIVQALYNENHSNVQHFGRSEKAPGVGDNPATLGNVRVWYDRSAKKISWHSDYEKMRLSAGSMAEFFKDCDNYISIDMKDILASAVTDMSSMFQGCTSLEEADLTGLDSSGASDISNMFQGCNNLETVTLTGFTTNNTSSVNMAGMFQGCSSLSGLTFPASFDTSRASNMASMFQGCSNLTILNLSGFNAGSASDMSSMFEGCANIKTLTLPVLTSATVDVKMAGLLKGCAKLTTLNGLGNIDTSRVTDMSSMFEDCSSIQTTKLNISNFNTSNVTNMTRMFKGCLKLTGTLNLSNFVTSGVTDMSYMFCECRGLSSINLSSFNTSNVTDMTCMFSSQEVATEGPQAMSLTSLNVSGFNTAKVKSMRQMFYLCWKLPSLDVSGFRTPLVEDMSYMFACYNYGNSKYPGKLEILNLYDWDFTNVTTTAHMFDRQQKLDAGLTFPPTTNFASLTTMTYMFSQCLVLSPDTFETIVGTWTFENQGDDYLEKVYGIGLEDGSALQQKTLFGNYEDSNAGQNAGANYIFRDTMTNKDKPFETRDSYTTQDNIPLYIGGYILDNNKPKSSEKYARLTTKPSF